MKPEREARLKRVLEVYNSAPPDKRAAAMPKAMAKAVPKKAH